MAAAIPVYVEIGSSKVFASAAPWPGWCRAGQNEEAALEALAGYAERYAPVAREAGLAWRKIGDLSVVERAEGGSTTNFGAPERTHDGERVRLTRTKAQGMAALLAAAWRLLDTEAARAPASLRKGPRGGGRDRDAMLDHVIGAETAYARKLGVRHRQPALDDSAAVAELRGEILAVVSAPTDGEPTGDKGWTTAYATRRLAWHVLDHLWELQDRS